MALGEKKKKRRAWRGEIIFGLSHGRGAYRFLFGVVRVFV
jgi:hypothetical protein